MPPTSAQKDTTLTDVKLPSVDQAKAEILLAFWNAGILEHTAISKGKLPLVAKRYSDVFQQLLNQDAIATKTGEKKSSKVFFLTKDGISQLGDILQTVEFTFSGTTTGAWMAVALLKWMQQMSSVASVATTNGKVSATGGEVGAIASYEEFKPVALTIFSKLDKGHNYAGLVPIWHLRQEFGDRVERADFNDWVMKMQAEQLFYLQSGEAIGATEEQKRNSISSEIRGLLFYVSQPS